MKRYGSVLAMTITASVVLACAVPATAQGDLGFDINVTLSKKAAAKLAAKKEGIVVFASYYGDRSGAPRSMPTKSARSISRRRTKRSR
ncbi:hypothetical protein NKI04_26085 [Mesorhizobium sp. M0814]|uniref:hypothetical protein n=1 Tax=unclassified Mesorhizobium TaxID=325217 RepID=UPI0033384B71